MRDECTIREELPSRTWSIAGCGTLECWMNVEDPHVGVVRVVTVDDHPLIRDIVRLACEPHTDLRIVGEASRGDEALDLCRRLTPDVLVLDIILPDMDGFAVVRRLRAEGLQPRVLAVTARTDHGAVFQARRLGLRGFLPKSVLAEKVADAIRVVARGELVYTDEQDQGAVSHLGDLVRRAREQQRLEAALTPRERQVLGMIASGLTTRQVATRLGLSPRTVESHIAGLYRTLGVRTRTEAVARALAVGLVQLDSEGER